MEVDDVVRPMKNIDETLLIQHDWHLGLKEPVSKFFLGVKLHDSSRTEFFDVQITKMVDEYAFAVMPGEGSIKSSDFTNISLDLVKQLSVTFRGRTTIFVAPVSEKQVNEFESAPHSFDVSSKGSTFMAADLCGSLYIASSLTYTLIRTLHGHSMDINRCIYFPSGLVALTGGIDRTLRIWSIESGECVRVLKGHTQAITGLGIIGVGKEILSCSNDGTARLWNCGQGETIETWAFEKGKCVNLSVSVDSSRFAVISELQMLSVIDLTGEKKRRDIRLPSEPSAVCFSGDEHGEVVFVGFEDGHIAAYNVQCQTLVGEIITRKGIVTCLKIFCNRLLVAFDSGSVFAYVVPNLPVEQMSSGDSSSNFSKVISAEYQLTGADCDPIYALSIHGRHVYTCCRDRKIRMYSLLWNV